MPLEIIVKQDHPWEPFQVSHIGVKSAFPADESPRACQNADDLRNALMELCDTLKTKEGVRQAKIRALLAVVKNDDLPMAVTDVAQQELDQLVGSKMPSNPNT